MLLPMWGGGVADGEEVVPLDNASLEPSCYANVVCKNRNGRGCPRNRHTTYGVGSSDGGWGPVAPRTDILDTIPRTTSGSNNNSSRASRAARDPQNTAGPAPSPGFQPRSGSQPRSRGSSLSPHRKQSRRNHQITGFTQHKRTVDDDDMVGRWDFGSAGEENSTSAAAVCTGITSPVASSVATAASVADQGIPSKPNGRGGGRLTASDGEADTQQYCPPVARTGAAGGAGVVGTSGRGPGAAMASAMSPPLRARGGKRGKMSMAKIAPVSNTAVRAAADSQRFSPSSPPRRSPGDSRNGGGEEGRGIKRLRPETGSVPNRSEPRLGPRGDLRRTQSCGAFEKKKLKCDGLSGQPVSKMSGCTSVGSADGGRGGDRAVAHARMGGYGECKFDATTSTSTTSGEGFAGDVGRWQHGLGIPVSVEGSSAGHGSGEGRRSPPTARELMRDDTLKEAFSSRGRHKKSPVLAR